MFVASKIALATAGAEILEHSALRAFAQDSSRLKHLLAYVLDKCSVRLRAETLAMVR